MFRRREECEGGLTETSGVLCSTVPLKIPTGRREANPRGESRARPRQFAAGIGLHPIRNASQDQALARRSALSCLEPGDGVSGSPTDPVGWDPRTGTALAPRCIAPPLVPADADTVWLIPAIRLEHRDNCSAPKR